MQRGKKNGQELINIAPRLLGTPEYVNMKEKEKDKNDLPLGFVNKCYHEASFVSEFRIC